MTDDERMLQIDTLLSHVWLVRTFLKHCEEAEEDEELRDVHRALYDFMLALGGPLANNDSQAYLKQAAKKISRLRATSELFLQIQPEISSHTNFKMAAVSLSTAVKQVDELLAD